MEDEVGAQEAVVSGMIWAVSRSIVPGVLYTLPGFTPSQPRLVSSDGELEGKFNDS
jgi:hypothetical protein